MRLFFITYNENPLMFVLFIAACVLGVTLILFFIILPFAHNRRAIRDFQKRYYKEIRKIADLQDYYLINNLAIRNNNQLICKIDHVLFGNKYIYVIKDRFYRGAISGNKNDKIWMFYTKGNKSLEMENPMKVNEKRVDKLSLVTQIDMSFFISIVLINDDCVVKSTKELNRDNSFIVSKRNLSKLIKTIEKRNVRNMDPKQLEYAVQDISRLFGRNKKGRGNSTATSTADFINNG